MIAKVRGLIDAADDPKSKMSEMERKLIKSIVKDYEQLAFGSDLYEEVFVNFMSLALNGDYYKRGIEIMKEFVKVTGEKVSDDPGQNCESLTTYLNDAMRRMFTGVQEDIDAGEKKNWGTEFFSAFVKEMTGIDDDNEVIFGKNAYLYGKYNSQINALRTKLIRNGNTEQSRLNEICK